MQVNKYSINTIGNGKYYMEWMDGTDRKKVQIPLLEFLNQHANNHRDLVEQFKKIWTIFLHNSDQIIDSEFAPLVNYIEDDQTIPGQKFHSQKEINQWYFDQLLKAFNKWKNCHLVDKDLIDLINK